MRKALRIVTVSAGITSIVSAIILAFIYFEDINGHLKVYKNKLFKITSNKNLIGKNDDID